MSQLTLGKESDFVGEIKITMWIPQELGGKVVGKQGILISNIKIETGCTLVNAMKPLDSSLWSAIVIIGIPSNALKAYKAIYDIVKGEVDDVVLEFSFNKTKHSFLLDTKGSNLIKKISADTNVRILIPKDSVLYPHASLEGACENVYNALTMFSKSYDEYYIQKKSSNQIVDKTTPVVNINSHNNRDDDKGGKRNQKTSKVQVVSNVSQQPPPLPQAKAVNNKPDKKIPPPPPSDSFEQTQSTVSPTPKVAEIKIEKKEFEKKEVIRMIDIPASIVGMLLIQQKKDKRGKVMMSVINKIQNYTSTRISRVNAPPEKVPKVEADKAAIIEEIPSVEGISLSDSVKVPDDDNTRRRRVIDSDEEGDGEDEDNDDDDDDDEEEDDGDDENEEDDDENEKDDGENIKGNDEKENTENVKDVVEKAKNDSQVPFKIFGYTEESVNEAAESIERIVSGERINEVISNLIINSKGKKLIDFKSGKVRNKKRFEPDNKNREGGRGGRGRGEGRGGRGEGRGGRGRGRGEGTENRDRRGPPKNNAPQDPI